MIYVLGKDDQGRLKTAKGVPGPACARCHGADASGGVGPDIRGATLSSDFNESTFARAVTKGLDEKGSSLELKMPRYAMSKADTQGLWLYLQTLK
jgi:mono/diheme cytochrome c family protein